MIAPTLKLGIAVLNGGNAAVQQVYSIDVSLKLYYLLLLGIPKIVLHVNKSLTWAILPFQAGTSDVNIMKH